MKKRLKGLLALSMVVVMALAMSTGVASAADYYYNKSDTGLNLEDQILLTGDGVIANGSGGSFAVTDAKGLDIISPTQSGDKINSVYDANQSVVSGKYCFDANAQGKYVVDAINTTGYHGFKPHKGVFSDYYQDANGTPLNSLYLEPNPITYILMYAPNGGTGTIPNETFNVRDNAAYTVNDGSTFTRHGYKLTGWNTQADGKGISVPLSSTAMDVAKLFEEAGIAPVDNSGQLLRTLYAQWEGGQVTPAPEQPLDDSPAAGDSFLVAPIIMLMLLSAGAAVAVKRRKA